MQTTPYLYFQGNCEAALSFYAGLGLGEMSEAMRYGGGPATAHAPPGWAEKIMHCRFQGPGLSLYAADTLDAEPMKGVALLLEPETVEAGQALFEKLSEGGRVTVPFAKQFWGDHYGNFTDRFGVQWAMNCTARP